MRRYRRDIKNSELQQAQQTVHTYTLAVEQALPETEVYEYMAQDLVDAVREEDALFMKYALKQKGYDVDCPCAECPTCRIMDLLDSMAPWGLKRE